MNTILELMKAKPSFAMLDYLAQYIPGFDNKLTKKFPRIKILLVNRELNLAGRGHGLPGPTVYEIFSVFLEKAEEFIKSLNKDSYLQYHVDSLYPHYPRFENHGEFMLEYLSEIAFQNYMFEKYKEEGE